MLIIDSTAVMVITGVSTKNSDYYYGYAQKI
jgi:hypothetical protein